MVNNKSKSKSKSMKGGSLLNDGQPKSQGPYVLTINKFKNNKYLIKDDKRFESTKEFSPASGAELDYNPALWNDHDGIRNSHNCYTYALGKIVPGLESKAQPGYASGYDHIEDYDCESFYNRLKNDSPASYVEKFDNSCVAGFYKVFLALDPQNDYHWWRMNSDGYWSHKPGSTEVVDVDASGKKIKNPLKANRNYQTLNYYKPCFFACVYSDLARSLDDIYS